MGPSIRSGGDGHALLPKDFDKLLPGNPFVTFHPAGRGYRRGEVPTTLWRTDFQTVP